MNNWLLFLIPLTAALIGWLTIRIAVRSFFHPRQPIAILGLSFQGIIPKRQKEFAAKMGKIVTEKFFSFDTIEQKISNPNNLEKIMPMIENHVDDFLRNRLGKEMPMIAMFIGDKTIGKLKEAFMKEIGLLFPQVMQQYASNMKTDLDIGGMVVRETATIPVSTIEEIFYKTARRELRAAGTGGAIIGFILGLVQLLLVRLLS